jgi:hypothetical protein
VRSSGPFALGDLVVLKSEKTKKPLRVSCIDHEKRTIGTQTEEEFVKGMGWKATMSPWSLWVRA